MHLGCPHLLRDFASCGGAVAVADPPATRSASGGCRAGLLREWRGGGKDGRVRQQARASLRGGGKQARRRRRVEERGSGPESDPDGWPALPGASQGGLAGAQAAYAAQHSGFRRAKGDGLCLFRAVLAAVGAARRHGSCVVEVAGDVTESAALAARARVAGELHRWLDGSLLPGLLMGFESECSVLAQCVREEVARLRRPFGAEEAWPGEVSIAGLAGILRVKIRVARVEIGSGEVAAWDAQKGGLVENVNRLLEEDAAVVQLVWWTDGGRGVHFDWVMPTEARAPEVAAYVLSPEGSGETVGEEAGGGEEQGFRLLAWRCQECDGPYGDEESAERCCAPRTPRRGGTAAREQADPGERRTPSEPWRELWGEAFAGRPGAVAARAGWSEDESEGEREGGCVPGGMRAEREAARGGIAAASLADALTGEAGADGGRMQIGESPASEAGGSETERVLPGSPGPRDPAGEPPEEHGRFVAWLCEDGPVGGAEEGTPQSGELWKALKKRRDAIAERGQCWEGGGQPSCADAKGEEEEEKGERVEGRKGRKKGGMAVKKRKSTGRRLGKRSAPAPWFGVGSTPPAWWEGSSLGGGEAPALGDARARLDAWLEEGGEGWRRYPVAGTRSASLFQVGAAVAKAAHGGGAQGQATVTEGKLRSRCRSHWAEEGEGGRREVAVAELARIEGGQEPGEETARVVARSVGFSLTLVPVELEGQARVGRAREVEAEGDPRIVVVQWTRAGRPVHYDLLYDEERAEEARCRRVKAPKGVPFPPHGERYRDKAAPGATIQEVCDSSGRRYALLAHGDGVVKRLTTKKLEWRIVHGSHVPLPLQAKAEALRAAGDPRLRGKVGKKNARVVLAPVNENPRAKPAARAQAQEVHEKAHREMWGKEESAAEAEPDRQRGGGDGEGAAGAWTADQDRRAIEGWLQKGLGAVAVKGLLPEGALAKAAERVEATAALFAGGRGAAEMLPVPKEEAKPGLNRLMAAATGPAVSALGALEGRGGDGADEGLVRSLLAVVWLVGGLALDHGPESGGVRGGKEVQAHPAPRERAAERRVAEVKRRRVRAEDQADAEVPRREREQARREEAKAEADVAFEEARRRWKETDAEITSDPFSFWRRVVKGFPASDGKGGETEIPASEFAHEARRLFQTCGAMGEEGGERDEGGWRRAAEEMARKGGRPPPPRVPFRMEPYTSREVRRSARARKQTTKPGWDGLVGAWWMLPALTRAAVAVVDWTRKARKPGVGMSWVEARFIQKNGKEVEEYKRNLKAWRVIGKPLTLTKVVEGARMRRRTDFFRENGYVDPTDPQKGNKGGLAGCVAHCAGLSEELAGMAAEARKGEVAFLDLRDAYSSAPHALLQVAEEWWHLPREETEFWKEADAAGTARVLVGKEEVWAGPVTVGVVAGGTASPDRFCLALEVVMRASDARVASERVILKDPRTGEKKERSSRKGLMDDTTLLVATVEAMQRELVKLAGDFKSVNLLVHPGKCVTGSIKRGHLKGPHASYELGGLDVPTVGELGTTKFLGDVLGEGRLVRKALLARWALWLSRVDAVECRGAQKLACYSDYVVPAWRYALSVQKECAVTHVLLEKMDAAAKGFLKRWAGLKKCTTVAFLWSTTGMGLPSMVRCGVEAQLSNVRIAAAQGDPELRRSLERALLKGALDREEVAPVAVAYALWQAAEGEAIGKAAGEVKSKRWKRLRALTKLGRSLAREAAAQSAERRKQEGAKGEAQGGSAELDEVWTAAATEGAVAGALKEEMEKEWEADAKVRKLVVQGEWGTLQRMAGNGPRWSGVVKTLPAATAEWARNAALRVLPDARNVELWGKEPDVCAHCGGRATDKHVLASCKAQGSLARFKWRHDSVLVTVVQLLREAARGDDAWVVAADLPGEVSVSRFLAEHGVVTAKVPDILVARMGSNGNPTRVWVVELSCPWEEAGEGLGPGDEWAAKAKAAGARWRNSLEKRSAAKRKKYEDEFEGKVPREWGLDVVCVEVGARGIVMAHTAEKLRQVVARVMEREKGGKGADARRGKETPGRKVARWEAEARQRVIAASHVVWAWRKKEWPEGLPLVKGGWREVDDLGAVAGRARREREEEEGAKGCLREEVREALEAEEREDEPNEAREMRTAGLKAARLEVEEGEDAAEWWLVYTDGSGADGLSGWGVSVWRGGKQVEELKGPVRLKGEKGWKGAEYHSNNAGELNGIEEALQWIREHTEAGAKVLIAPDSLWAANEARQEGEGSRRGVHAGLALRAREARRAVEERCGRLVWGWVKGHEGHAGNELADALADEGRLLARKKGQRREGRKSGGGGGGGAEKRTSGKQATVEGAEEWLEAEGLERALSAEDEEVRQGARKLASAASTEVTWGLGGARWRTLRSERRRANPFGRANARGPSLQFASPALRAAVASNTYVELYVDAAPLVMLDTLLRRRGVRAPTVRALSEGGAATRERLAQAFRWTGADATATDVGRMVDAIVKGAGVKRAVEANGGGRFVPDDLAALAKEVARARSEAPLLFPEVYAAVAPTRDSTFRKLASALYFAGTHLEGEVLEAARVAVGQSGWKADTLAEGSLLIRPAEMWAYSCTPPEFCAWVEQQVHAATGVRIALQLRSVDTRRGPLRGWPTLSPVPEALETAAAGAL